MFHVESLLSARLFVSPQLVGDQIYFISNLSGRLSLYRMKFGASVPEPLLPPDIALQNPHLVGGAPFLVFPALGKILVLLDHDGDENYLPMLIPLDGGFPEPAFNGFFEGTRVHVTLGDDKHNLVYLGAESRQEPVVRSYQCNLATGSITELAVSPWGTYPAAFSKDHRRIALLEGYTFGDVTVYLWENGTRKVLYGVPLEDRLPSQEIPLNGIGSLNFTPDEQGLLVTTALYTDTFSPAYLDLSHPGELKPIEVIGLAHSGVGELVSLEHLKDNRYLLEYNIDGCSWLYEVLFDASKLSLTVSHVLVGQGELANGVLFSHLYDESGDRMALSFSTATSPTQIYTIDGDQVVRHTNERVLGIPTELLSPGEDASFVSYDGTRVSARLYLPAPALGFDGKRPLVYYIHGGPQSQERPDFAWFSIPLIQYLTLNGFAVFVPNARGSTGYGLSYTKQVDHDWGGRDRLDHVHALEVLAQHPRVDVHRAGVVGRSYGGYMTLTQAMRHPDLWRGAVDMFGPYDLITFMERIPETWKPYFRIAVGDPIEDREFLMERSPKTYAHQLACPMLVIQGKNDPRVVERESRDVVEYLRSQGKQVEYLMFENEGHDVLKFENRVRCYLAITEFFSQHLGLEPRQ